MSVVLLFVLGGVFFLTGMWALVWGGPLWQRAVRNERTVYAGMSLRDKHLLRARWVVVGSGCALVGLVLLLIAPHLA